MQRREGPPGLPEGYRLDLTSDPDAPALRRPDSTLAARFSARGMSEEAVKRVALEDVVHGSEAVRSRRPTPRTWPT